MFIRYSLLFNDTFLHLPGNNRYLALPIESTKSLAKRRKPQNTQRRDSRIDSRDSKLWDPKTDKDGIVIEHKARREGERREKREVSFTVYNQSSLNWP
jgi:hypothetical protein